MVDRHHIYLCFNIRIEQYVYLNVTESQMTSMIRDVPEHRTCQVWYSPHGECGIVPVPAL